MISENIRSETARTEEVACNNERQLAIKDVYEPFNCRFVHTLKYGISEQPVHCYLGFSHSGPAQEWNFLSGRLSPAFSPSFPITQVPGALASALALASLLFEPDSLRERKVRAIVDRYRLPAHICLPGIAATLTATSGLFLAAECSSDLSSTCADVDVRNATVASPIRSEFFCLSDIGRKDCRAKSLRHLVMNFDRLVELVVGEHVEDRGKCFLLNHRPTIARFGNAGCDIIVAQEIRPPKTFAPVKNFAARFLKFAQGIVHRSNGRCVDQWPHQYFRAKWITDGYTTVGRLEFLHQTVLNRFLYDQPARCRAALPGCSNRSKEKSTYGKRQIG